VAGAQAAEASLVKSAEPSYAQLFAGFRAMTGLEARFEEEKYLALLAAPLRSSGSLYFLPPSTLLRRVEEPRRQEILIQASRIRISQGAEVQTIDLGVYREIRPLVDSLIWIFTGDLASIEEVYRVEYEVFELGTGERAESRWQMTLSPKRAPLSSLLRKMKVRGAGLTVSSIELIETSGDRTLTHFSHANSRRVFDTAEQLELFGIDPQ
jgi:hypothetical protein